MPENFEIIHTWVFWLLPLPVVMYLIFPALKIKSAALLIPNIDKSAKYTSQTPKKASFSKKKKFKVIK